MKSYSTRLPLSRHLSIRDKVGYTSGMNGFPVRIPPLLLPLAILVLLLAGGCAPGRKMEAAFLLADLAAGEQTSWLKRHTPDPERRQISFNVDGRTYAADLYRSPEGILAPVLLIPGAAEEGKNDPRLIAFAASLARARFAVLVPDFPALRALRVEAENAGEVADVFAWLLSRPELAPAGRGGMVAFSYAAGPAILAAMKGEIRSRVQFIMAVGGYFSLPETLTFITTGWFRHQDRGRYLEPNAYGKWVFVLSNLHRVAEPADRARLKSMAERKLRDLEVPVEDLAERLGPEGKSIHAFLINRDPHLAPLLMRELPEPIRLEIAALDLAALDLSPLRAKLLLVHGYEDDIIPFPQSIALARAVPESQAELFLAHGLLHVELQPGPGDLWKLWKAIEALLTERDRMVEAAADKVGRRN